MRRRIPALVLAAMVVLTAAPASAAEPDPGLPIEPSPIVDPTPPVEPTPTPDPTPAPEVTLEPTPEPETETPAEPSADPEPSPTAEDSPSPSAEASPAPTTEPDVSATPEANGGLDTTGEFIVVLRSTADTAAVVEEHEDEDGIDAGRRFSKVVRGFTADLDENQVEALLDDPDVVAVVPDEIIELTAQTVPTGVSRVGTRQSAIAKINGADERVDADVAIVDTGIYKHADLNVAGGYNCSTSNRAAWGDGNGHGTHVAGTVAALDNSYGVVGVAPGARLWAVRILNSEGYGKLSWYVCGLDWILSQRDHDDPSLPMIEAVNMSVAKSGKDDSNCGKSNKDVLHQAVCRLVKGGVTVVAAAANDHASAARKVPAAYNEVITVSALADTDGKPGALGGKRCFSWGAYDLDDTFANFSNYGSDVDLIAPGKCIWSTKPGNTYGYSSGTSMAAPAVTGAVALYKASRPHATPTEVKEALQYLGNLNWKTSTDPDSRHEKLLDVSKLGPLGSFSMGTASVAALGETGGTRSVPITLSRSSAFFERVRLRLSGVPSGWTAKLGSTSLLGRSATKTTLTVAVPRGTSAGTYRITVTGTNQGRTKTATATVVVENDKPTARPATGSVTGGTVGTTVPVRLSWAAATDPSSGIAGYQLQIRQVGGAWGGTTSLPASARSIVRSFKVSTSYESRIRARDKVGNWGSWVTSAAPTRVIVVDDRHSSIRYTASWVKTTSSAALADTLRRSVSLGARAEYSFTGRGISVVAPKGPGRAKLAVYVDGVYKTTVNLRTKGTHDRRIVYAARWSSVGAHRITLRIVSSGKVQLDAFLLSK